MSENMQAVLTIDPELMPMLGSNMYSNHAAVVLTRELMQNAVDATKRRVVQPNITLTYEFADKATYITCDDNGDGMTATQLLGDFLRVGGRTSTNKDFTKEVGGFGLAKIAILWNQAWEVHSLDNFLDKDALFDGGNIKKVTPREGTRVSVTADVRSWGIEQLCVAYITFSDVDVQVVTMKKDGTPVNHGQVGLKQKMVLMDDEDASGINWRAYLVDKFESCGFTMRGYNVYRLKGLVQFVSKSSYREANVIIDIDDMGASPRDDDYPFSTSRESIKDYQTRHAIEALINRLDTDSLSTQTAFQEKPEKPASVIAQGCAIGLHLPPEFFSEDGTVKHTANPNINADKVLNMLLQLSCGYVPSSRSSNSPAMLFRYYDAPEDDATKEKHALVLSAWTKIVNAVTQEPCGVGFTGLSYENASRYHDDLPYILINPDNVLTRLFSSPGGLFLHLWQLAVHEAAHSGEFSHNERFTSKETTIAAIAGDAAWDTYPSVKMDLTKIVRAMNEISD